ncbi:hypothetical protein ASC95_03740 [Pelomonas sp. Root1217]|uniref:hypothetical protein n=1 Tax=Pelomonas sp. Root1217 TaxID=1736430 RepID=UPI00070DC3B9|nr:hypothetical protein [Pelomonas sp. Root1217]KQV60569.1 hypothetical protein ASC95_03740 [Pelomonas sp. Root1217]
MRAAFSLLALVIVAAIVLSLAKKQATALKPLPGSPAASAALPMPKAVGEQVQNSVDEAARRAAEAASAATN